MFHPLVTQLHFARSEFMRCLDGISDADARRRLQPMNCISWIIGHLANQEHLYWVVLAQEKNVAPQLREVVGDEPPATMPPLAEMWETWRTVAKTADAYLQPLTPAQLQTHFTWKGDPVRESVGTMLLRNIYHYWFHLGEAHAIRQMLGHEDLPQFVGSMAQALYRPFPH